jgi:hypothetical protein
MIIFGVLIVNCGLLLKLVILIAGTMPCLYSCLRGLVHLYSDTMNTMLIIALSR